MISDAHSTWDVDAVGTALNAQATSTTDLHYGEGVQFALGEEGCETRLELFPSGPRAPIVRLTTADWQLSLFQQDKLPALTAEGLVFEGSDEHERRRLLLAPSGATTLAYEPQRATSPQDEPHPENRPEPHPAVATSIAGDSEGQEAYQRSLPEPRQDGQPRVTFAGRLGTDPRCRTTPREIRVCSFPVAEKREASDTPTWLTVVAFKALAAKVEATLKKGVFVEGVGYHHEKIRKARDGSTRTETEIYAVVVTPR